MKISLLNPEDPGVFAHYLPDFLPRRGTGLYRTLAFHEGETAWGAAVVEVGEDAVDIVSLSYDESISVGVCERALTEFLVERSAGSLVKEIRCICLGTKEELKALDDQMLEIGYFPRAGRAHPMEAVLHRLLENPVAKQLMQYQPGACIAPLEEGRPLQLYNRSHPAAAVYPGEWDPHTSRCYMESGEIKAILHTRFENGMLYLEWLSNSSSKNEVVGWLLGSALTAAAQHYPPETLTVLGTLPGSSAKMAEKLGFEPVSGDVSTRIYTYYLD